MSEHADIKHEQNIDAIHGLQDWVSRIDKRIEAFTEGMGKRVDENNKNLNEHETRLVLLETSVGALLKVCWMLAFISTGIVVTAFYKLIIK